MGQDFVGIQYTPGKIIRIEPNFGLCPVLSAGQCPYFDIIWRPLFLARRLRTFSFNQDDQSETNVSKNNFKKEYIFVYNLNRHIYML
mgnify:CR=1 FL=1